MVTTLLKLPQNGFLDELYKVVKKRKSETKSTFLIPLDEDILMRFDNEGNILYYYWSTHRVALSSVHLLLPQKIVHSFEKNVYLSNVIITKKGKPKLTGTWKLKPEKVLLLNLRKIKILQSKNELYYV